jgi:hypothetical protein
LLDEKTAPAEPIGLVLTGPRTLVVIIRISTQKNNLAQVIVGGCLSYSKVVFGYTIQKMELISLI